MRFLILPLFFVTACGGQIYLHEKQHDNKSHVDTCSFPTGEYNTHWTTLSGDCGDQPDEVINVEDLLNQIAESTVNSDQWSADDCTENLDYTRTDPATGEVAHWVDAITCLEKDCLTVSEQMSITATWGSQTCTGTYEINWAWVEND
jgi:hypothetical protein